MFTCLNHFQTPAQGHMAPAVLHQHIEMYMAAEDRRNNIQSGDNVSLRHVRAAI